MGNSTLYLANYVPCNMSNSRFFTNFIFIPPFYLIFSKIVLITHLLTQFTYTG